MSSSKSSALGMSSLGKNDVKAALPWECFRSNISIFLRSRFAWCADRPAVLKGSGDKEQGHGKAF